MQASGEHAISLLKMLEGVVGTLPGNSGNARQKVAESFKRYAGQLALCQCRGDGPGAA